MVKLRLRRTGAKKQATYRIVAANALTPRDGRFIETLGHYNPRTEPPTIVVNEEGLMGWLFKGAQPSESLKQILVTCGFWKKYEERQAASKKKETA